ncbi:MAG: hypothetical protein JNM07_07720 [Phycisphaerae bacterium]|nr:hypothetical protein [Phycisphaerae bacterium]
MTTAAEGARTTTLNKKWWIKIVIFLVVLAGFGVWGLADALYFYPERGRVDARYQLKAYLEEAERTNQMSFTSVSDPAAEYAKLDAASKDLRVAQSRGRNLLLESQADTPEGRRARLELAKLSEDMLRAARLDWLYSLRLVGACVPAGTVLDQPEKTLAELREYFSKHAPPKPLNAYDIPLQWVIVVVGLVGAAWVGLNFIRAARTSFRYDPSSHTLTVPDGRAVTPADVKEFDKRKWDKFFVTLHLKDGSAPLKLDLLKFTSLEEWILEMERIAFPESAKASAGQGGEDAAKEEPASAAGTA